MPGREVFDVPGSLLWTQRISKEEKVNACIKPGFSLRNAVSVVDVPAKFKPGHINPARDGDSLKRWDPADNGWDPCSAEAREFRRCLNSQTGGPRGFEAYPVTSSQELGWFLSAAGAPGDRIRRQKGRMGFGWQPKHPSEWSESTANAPPVLGRSSSSQLSAAPAASVLTNSAPVDGGSQVGAASQADPASPPPPVVAPPPPAAGRGHSDSGTELSRASSLPAFMLHPVDRLSRREAKLSRVMAEVSRYHNNGELGSKYAKGLGMTDATKFDNEFCQANCGVPLHKTLSKQVVTLKDKHGMPVGKWRC